MADLDPERWRVLEPLLDEAIELSPEELASWLEELRGRSPDLAADLASMLVREEDANRAGFLNGPPLDLAALLNNPSISLEGLEVGAYTIERLLGSGGMGAVWLARRTDGQFEGRVAVKLMNLSLIGSAGQKRFRREGTTLARLTHPGIARLLDAGVASTRQPYLVIELVDGEPIDAYTRAHQLTQAQRIRLVLQVLDAVGHAHANLVVHRDLKPSNILVTADGTIKLLDFGIARLLEGESGEARTALTADGHALLTPEFAAPEQALGGAVTTATDVYAVGVLLYLLLSGRHPTAHQRLDTADSIRALLEVEPRRLGAGDLDTVLAKALRKAPVDRYQSVKEFADDLRRYLAQEPIAARPHSVGYRTRKFVRRHRMGVGLAALVSVALIAASVFSIAQMQEARAQRNEAVRSERRVTAMSELQAVLASDARTPDDAPLSTAERLAMAERVLVRRFHDEPWLVASAIVNLAGQLLESGDLPGYRAMLSRARLIARDGDQPNELALASCSRAINFWLTDDLDSARADIREARAALVGLRRVDPVVESTCLEAEGKLLQATGNADSSIAVLERALALVEARRGSERLGVMNALAEVLRLSGRTREAAPYFRHIITQLDTMGYGDTEGFMNGVAFLSASLVDLGEFATLDSTLLVFIREREATRGEGRVPAPYAFYYGHAKLRMGAIDSADLWLARAVRDSTQASGVTATLLYGALAQLRLDQGRLNDARAALEQLPDQRRGQRATAAMLRSRLRRMEGDTTGAAAALETELGALWGDGQPRLTLFALPLITAAEWRLQRGDAGRADTLARMAVVAGAIDSLAHQRSALVGRAELLRAHALRATGDLPGARQAVARAAVALGSGYGPSHPWTRSAGLLADSLGR